MKIAIILFLINWLTVVDGAKILIVMAFESKSHTNIHEAIARALGSKGHQVTLMTTYPMNGHCPNVEWVQIGKPQEAGRIQFDIYEQRKQTIISSIIQSWNDDSMAAIMTLPCQNLYTNPKVKSILEEAKTKGKVYDVAIWDSMFSEYTLPFLGMVANHTVLLSVVPLPPWLAHYFRIPYPTSVLPSFMSHFSTPTDVWQRLECAGNTYFMTLLYMFASLYNFQTMANQYLPPETPLVKDVLKNLSFIFTNEDPIMVSSRPSSPFVASVAGIHLQESKPLPKDLEDFMQSSGDDGVILFSFGSYFDTKLMPKQLRNAFVNAFSRLNQKVIWKYHEPIEGISDNVKIVSWMPQRDILAHPKLRLFITHGGRLSSMEVVHHGVPVIGIALFADQMQNVDRLSAVGMGLNVDLTGINAEGIYDSILTILNNNSYLQRAKELSSIFRDRQNSPADTVNYWIEYIIRHNGASHLKNEMIHHLSWWQYLQLDVLAVMFLILVSILFTNILAIKLVIKIFRILKGTNTKNKKE